MKQVTDQIRQVNVLYNQVRNKNSFLWLSGFICACHMMFAQISAWGLDLSVWVSGSASFQDHLDADVRAPACVGVHYAPGLLRMNMKCVTCCHGDVSVNVEVNVAVEIWSWQSCSVMHWSRPPQPSSSRQFTWTQQTSQWKYAPVGEDTCANMAILITHVITLFSAVLWVNVLLKNNNNN